MNLNYYFSGIGISKMEEIGALAPFCPYRLLSCHGAYTNFAKKWLSVIPKDKSITILLDSGAFTAWSKGDEVKLDELIKTYYEIMSNHWSSCKEIYLINLDKIPGSPGVTAGKEEIEHCIKVSDQNYNILVKEFGDRVLPVFHQNEDEKRLIEVCNMAPYVCISPRNDLPEKYRISWSKEVHAKIPHNKMTHGLATTGVRMMLEVPWTSVDSATWIFLASTGTVILCINEKLKLLSISEKSPNRHDTNQHYTTLSRLDQSIVDKRLIRYELTAQDLAISLFERMKVSMFEIYHWLYFFQKDQLIRNYQESIFDL